MKYVIHYEDQTYESNGWGVPLSEAMVWASREEAERWVENIGQGTVIEHPDPTLQPEPSLWIEGGWNGREPVVPEYFPEFVWVAIYYPWKRGGAEARPHAGDAIKTMLHSVSLHFAAQAERDGKPVLPPPRWVWMPLDEVMIPAFLITRATLDGVARVYETGVLPTDPDTCVLWDALQVAGCEVLVPTVGDVKQGSALHRWIVLDAIQSAESVPQDEIGRAAIEAARTWVADPSEENRVAASAASSSAHAAARAAAYAAAYNAAYYAAYYAASAARAAAAHAAASSAAASSAAASSAYAAKLRLRVLATMAQAGVLPNLIEKKP